MLGELVRFQSIRSRLLEVYASAYASMKIYFRYPMWFISDIVTTPLWIVIIFMPILLFLPESEWRNPEIIEAMYWGMIFLDLISLTLWGIGMSIRREQQQGTIEYLFITNASRAVIFSNRVFSRILSLLMDVAYIALIINLIFGVSITIVNPIELFVYLAISVLLALGLGMMYGAVVLYLKNPGALNNILQFIILGLGGIFIPPSRMPYPLNIVSLAIPFSYAIDLVRNAAMGTQTMIDKNLEIFILLVSTMASIITGRYILSKLEEVNKRSGKLGTY
ncbi:MAG: hypothetical protein B6U94_08205 [Thermofilum sp. ex4484_79]|nr:MAG: hypothetical protein B6U94_08205 [Thermofilum sp. ex4484_79]